jgi:hypothetical protein
MGRGCVICGTRYESGGIETGFTRFRDCKVQDHVCPDCMNAGVGEWKKILLERAREKRERAKVAAQELFSVPSRLGLGYPPLNR